MMKRFKQKQFDKMIGRLDHALFGVVRFGKRFGDLDEDNRQTIKHHVEDMQAAAHRILEEMEKHGVSVAHISIPVVLHSHPGFGPETRIVGPDIPAADDDEDTVLHEEDGAVASCVGKPTWANEVTVIDDEVS